MEAVRLLYVFLLLVTVITALNFVWMAAGPGPKQNIYRILQQQLSLDKPAMNMLYLFVGFSSLATLLLSLGFMASC